MPQPDGTHSATFGIDRGSSRTVRYVDFLPREDDLQVDTLSQDARDHIEISCTEPDGLTHSWDFD